MSQLGNLGFSALHGSQELNIALANLKFDFSLVKIEAPVEYRGLGESLSKRRKIDAEGGSCHITARKLGALFEDAIPDTPNVFQAYGRRVTQIAQTPQYNPKGTSADGPFADHIGADGTTIWAAATSGKDAIAVHLLACLLARLWKAPEAISIWTQIVAQRKEAVRGQINSETFPINALVASQIDVRREQLAEWDASASLPITKNGDVYRSVMEVWIKALKTMDLLVQGMPQRIQEGAVLLALASWHLYPDICALGAESKMVRLDDPLVRDGGIVTVGLQNSDPERAGGIFWSLPLAHLRFYGDPVVKTASAGDQSSRVSMDQFQLVLLGSVMSTWGKFGSDILTPITLISDLFGQSGLESWTEGGWLRPILAATSSFLNAKDHQREELSRLVQFGMRRGGDFLTTTQHPPAMFGITDMYFLVNGCPNLNSRLACLRNASESFDLVDEDDAIIRYYIDGGKDARYTRLKPRHASRKRTRDGQRIMTKQEVEASFHWRDTEDVFIEGYLDPSKGELSIRKCIRLQQPFSVKAGCPLGHGGFIVPCEFVYGDPFTAAVFRPLRGRSLSLSTNRVSVLALPRIFQTHKLDLGYFQNQWASYQDMDFYRSLRGIAWARELYLRLPSATISLKSTASPICDSQRCMSFDDALDDTRSLAVAFACIAALETGDLDLDPSEINGSGAMAISYGNSIYVAERVISDPVEVLSGYAIRRMTGNIGKPGLSVLIPPVTPKTRKIDFESWNVVNHASFNGRLEDNFTGTSLHLSFSDYQLPIDTGKYGQCDQECCFIEAIISVYDQGQWIADVDIIKASRKWLVGSQKEAELSEAETAYQDGSERNVHKVGRDSQQDELEMMIVDDHASYHGDSYRQSSSSDISKQIESLEEERDRDKSLEEDERAVPFDWIRDIESRGDLQYAFEFNMGKSSSTQELALANSRKTQPNCTHDADARLKYSHLEPFTSVDSWPELLDPPLSNAIVRAFKNKIARLCVATVATQLGFNIHIIKNSTCWPCEFANCCSDEQHTATLKVQRSGEYKSRETPEEERPVDSHHLFIC